MPPRARSPRFVIVLMLTLAMVFAHWQGLAHRIGHASQHAAALGGFAAKAAPGSQHQAIPHSCLAYDAATVAPALHTPGCTAGILPSGRVLAQWTAFDSWDAPFMRHFASRAPPLA